MAEGFRERAVVADLPGLKSLRRSCFIARAEQALEIEFDLDRSTGCTDLAKLIEALVA